MSALEAFVNEQKKKSGGALSSSASGGFGGIGLPSSASFSSLGSKLSSSLSGIPLLSRSETVEVESLAGDAASANGQLPGAKNRKNTSGGWLGSWGAAASQEESYFGMSRTQRLFAFFLSFIGAGFCFITAAMLIPVLLLQTRKFAALNTLGSVLLLLSFAFLWGPGAYLTHLLSPARRLCTVAYFSALLATLYSSLWLQSTIFTLIAAVFQTFTLVWFVLSYVPGGERGLRWMTSFFTGFVTKGSTTVLPI